MMKAGKGATYVGIQGILRFIIGLLYYSIIARLLTEAEVGVISTLTFINLIFIIIASLSLPIAATKYISEFIGQNDKEKASAVAKKTIRLVFFLSIFLFIGIYLIIEFFLGYIYTSKVVVIISCATAFLATIRNTYLEFLRGLQMFGKYS